MFELQTSYHETKFYWQYFFSWNVSVFIKDLSMHVIIIFLIHDPSYVLFVFKQNL